MNMVSTPMAGEEEEGGYSEAELVSLASISDLDLGTQPPLFEAEVRAAPANTNNSFPEVASGSRRQRSGSDVFEMTRPKGRCKNKKYFSVLFQIFSARNNFPCYFKYFPPQISSMRKHSGDSGLMRDRTSSLDNSSHTRPLVKTFAHVKETSDRNR